MAISTNQKLTIYRNLYQNTGPAFSKKRITIIFNKFAGGDFINKTIKTTYSLCNNDIEAAPWDDINFRF